MNKSIDLLYICFLLLLSSSIYLANPNPKIKVLGVVEIMRHGARAPLVKFKKTKDLYFGAKRSQLTINGFRQHILLGRWLRRRYIEGDVEKLLDKEISKLDPTEIKIYSSPLQRTIFSASAHILGLFPRAIIKPIFEGRSEIRNNDIPPIETYEDDKRDGKEVTFSVINDKEDNLFRVKLCKRKDSISLVGKEMKMEEVFKIGYEELQQAIDDILNNYGEYFKSRNYKTEFTEDKYTLKTLKTLIKFLMPVHYHTDVKLNVKDNTMATIKKRMLNRFYQSRLEDSLSKKLLVSRMFDIILTFIENRFEGKNKEKMLIFSGHDFTLMNVISNLFSSTFLRGKIFSSLNNKEDYLFLLPPLASSFLIEIVQSQVDFKKYVRIVYNGEEVKSGYSNAIDYNNEEGILNYEQFKSLLISRIEPSYKELKCDTPEKTAKM